MICCILCVWCLLVESKVYFNCLIPSLNLKQFKLHLPGNFGNSSYHIKVSDIKVFFWYHPGYYSKRLNWKPKDWIQFPKRMFAVTSWWISEQPANCEVCLKVGIKEYNRKNYPFDLLTTWKSRIHVLLALVVSRELIQFFWVV